MPQATQLGSVQPGHRAQGCRAYSSKVQAASSQDTGLPQARAVQAEAWEVPSGCLPRKEGKPKGLGPVAIVIVTLTVTGEEQSRTSPPPIGYPCWAQQFIKPPSYRAGNLGLRADSRQSSGDRVMAGGLSLPRSKLIPAPSSTCRKSEPELPVQSRS